jgi:hypothetical protein
MEMSDLVERLRGIYRTPITDGLGPVGSGDEPNNPDEFVRTFPVPPIHREAADEIERLTESNNALMVEREMLIKTKRDQIERLTAERDAALAKVAQYEQAPVVGWVCDDFIQDPCGSASCHNCGKRRFAHITTRPEVTK